MPWLLVFLLAALLLAVVAVGAKSPAASAAIVLVGVVAYLFLPEPEVMPALAGAEAAEDDGADDALLEPAIPEILIDDADAEVRAPRRRVKPTAAGLPGTTATGPVAAFDDPRAVDAARESEWFEDSASSMTDAQREDREAHRKMRRGTLWSATSKWTPADKKRYETMRRRIESRIAHGLRSDGNMVVEADEDGAAEDKSFRTDQPWAAIASQDQSLFHSRGFLWMSRGTGDLASHLKTKI